MNETGRPPREFWRSLDELAEEPAFFERLQREFPTAVEAIVDPVERRTFLRLMGASLGLGGLSGAAACTRQPAERIVPYVRQPEEVVPGKPLFFATSMMLGGVATGLLVESHEGRPTKAEGNPDHPDSLGATDVFGQATILDLYDPDRARGVTSLGEARTWDAFLEVLQPALAAQESKAGAGLRILSEATSSATFDVQMRELLARFPEARWHQWDPTARDSAYAGARQAFGETVEAHYRLDRADVILALDSDFLASGPGSVRHAREFARRRRPEEAGRMNRLYAVESMPSPTGSRAYHRLAVRPSEVETLARRMAGAIGVAGATTNASFSGRAAERAPQWAAAVAKDLLEHKGSSLVVAGDTQPAAVHALAHAMNVTLGNVGATVVYTAPTLVAPVDQVQSLRALVEAMSAGQVELLVILSANPVYTAPVDLKFGEAMEKVALRIHLSSHQDETSARAQWHVAQSHFLESWSDGRASDGTASVAQPLIAPLYETKSVHEVLALFGSTPDETSYDAVRRVWSKTAGLVSPEDGSPTPEFETAWRRWLHNGVIPASAFEARPVTLRPDAVATRAATVSAGAGRPGSDDGNSGLEVQFRLDPTVLDGRFGNNGWLQELPKPITKLTWDNAVLVSPTTAAALGAMPSIPMQGGEHGQTVSRLVDVRFGGRSVRGPLFPVVGHPDGCVTLHLGYGRRRGGQTAANAGFDAYGLRGADSLLSGGGVEIVATGETYSLACVQAHHSMEGRGLVRAATRDEFVKDPKAAHHGFHEPLKTLTLNPDYEYPGYKWGMAIDINVCTGCNACVVGCQAENNIAIVGKDQVLRGREMHWLRVDSYYRGDPETPETYFQPVPCQQCENAPCEVVCPVNATVHSHEGLNDMVYNRCVGTRYCSNNCPYKVRRFNYYLYQDWETPSLKLGRNPDVTVRTRGVMEKCTYCVQRINEAKITAEKGNRRVADGEIKTACQSACPTDAIVFGDLNDPASRVAKLQAEPRTYSMLAELNTRPRTTYLAAVRNVNPEMGE